MAQHLVLDVRKQRATDVELADLATITEREAVRAILAGDLRLARRFAAVAHEARARLERRKKAQAGAPQFERRQAIAAEANETYASMYGR